MISRPLEDGPFELQRHPAGSFRICDITYEASASLSFRRGGTRSACDSRWDFTTIWLDSTNEGVIEMVGSVLYNSMFAWLSGALEGGVIEDK